MNGQVQTLVGVVVTAVVTGVVSWLVSRRKDHATAADAITSAAGKLVDRVEADNGRLRAQVRHLESLVEQLSDRIEELRGEVRAQRELIIEFETENASLRETVQNWPHPPEGGGVP